MATILCTPNYCMKPKPTIRYLSSPNHEPQLAMAMPNKVK
jgi:hypothetical protein